MCVLKRLLFIFALAFCTAPDCYASAPPGDNQAATYPKIVVYTAWYCSSCKAAGDYLTKNRIPFVKKDVDLNENYMEELSTRYKVNAVPVIVIGNNDKVLRGFNRDVFDSAMKEVMAKYR